MNPLFTSLSQGYAQVFQWLQQQQLPQARTLAHQLVHEYPEAATAYVALAAVASETGELAAAENAMQQALDLIETAAVLEPRRLRDGAGNRIEQPSPVEE